MTTPQPQSRNPHSRWIWPFELMEQIGEGGMGVVYRARYVPNDRQVALKMLPADVKDDTALARFERELEVLKTLRHPNIVLCFGGACEDQRRFYAMELVEGGTLEDKLQERGKLSWEQVVFYALQMCAGLEFSHQRGVVHRDVKPSNFLLTSAGQLKLGDFGLASVAASRKITAAGKTAGTFLYMAPEQIRGKAVGPQTDLYALGCVLYELLTGEPPFQGETPAATLHLHCHAEPPRPTEKAFDCPVSLERIILQLLEKDPKDRPESAAAVALELKGVSPVVAAAGLRQGASEQRRAEPRAARRTMPGFDDSPASSSLAQEKLFRTTVALAVALTLSLIWNVSQVMHARKAVLWEQAWLEAAASPETEVRVAAAAALGTMAPHSAASRSALVQGLADSSPKVRAQCALGLEQAGFPARSTIPALLKIRNNDPQPTVRDAAEAALAAIRSAEKQGFPWGTLSLVLLLAAGAAGFVWYRKNRIADGTPPAPHALSTGSPRT